MQHDKSKGEIIRELRKLFHVGGAYNLIRTDFFQFMKIVYLLISKTNRYRLKEFLRSKFINRKYLRILIAQIEYYLITKAPRY
jgi:hypothetical protein